MIRRIRIVIAHVLFWLSTLSDMICFFVAARDGKKAQERILGRILNRNCQTMFGMEHQFGSIKNIEMFQRTVPTRQYEDFVPYINHIMDGDASVLTDDSVDLLVPTSGSTHPSKYIPHTSALRADFQKGINPWIGWLYATYPKLGLGTLYWSLTPALRKPEQTWAGLWIDFPEDTAYFAKVQQWVINTISAVPWEIGRITDIEAFRYCTLLFLLSHGDLGMISVWHPTYLTLLLADLPRLLSDLIHGLEQHSIPDSYEIDEKLRKSLTKRLVVSRGRIVVLRKILNSWNALEKTQTSVNGSCFYQAIWPKLMLVSCWTEGTAKEDVGIIKKMLPHVAIQPKGLLATEALISFPLMGASGILSINSHFFEFQEVRDDGKEESIFLAHQLQKGSCYRVIVTTSGGLYRYVLGDIIEVTGWWHSLPTLRFVGRGDNIVDLVGEKLHEVFVVHTIEEIFLQLILRPLFWMVAPEHLSKGTYRYVLFLQFSGMVHTGILFVLTERIEHVLRKNYHYNYARELGQLESITLFLIDPFLDAVPAAEEIFMRASYNLGQQLGSIKIPRLHRYEHWTQHFSGIHIHE